MVEAANEIDGGALQRPRTLRERTRVCAALVAQLGTLAALGAYTRFETAPQALPITLACLAFAGLLSLWAAQAWNAAPRLLRGADFQQGQNAKNR